MSEQLYCIQYDDGACGVERRMDRTLAHLRLICAAYASGSAIRRPVRVRAVDDRWWLLKHGDWKSSAHNHTAPPSPLSLAEIQEFLATDPGAAPPYRLVHA